MNKNPYIFKKRSGVHGWGMFAKTDIPKGTRVIEYVGKKITKAQAEIIGPQRIEKALKNHDMGAVYLFDLNKKYDLDGNVPYNTAKYINHSCHPNCETDIIRGHIWVIAKRNIKKGDEITYNYGYDLDTFEDHPCKCGTERCVGYIVVETKWKQLKKILAKRDHKK